MLRYSAERYPMNAILKPIKTIDAFFKAYTHAIDLLQLKLKKGSRNGEICLTSSAISALKGKELCPLTAVAYLRTRKFSDLADFQGVARLARITLKVATTVVEAADNCSGVKFDRNVRTLLLEPFPKLLISSNR